MHSFQGQSPQADFIADASLAHHIPLGRIGDAEDLAPMAMLSKADIRYVTGSAFVVDGGLFPMNCFDLPTIDEI